MKVALAITFFVAIGMGAINLGNRYQHAVTTCHTARMTHHLIGPMSKCIWADTVLQEDDDQ